MHARRFSRRFSLGALFAFAVVAAWPVLAAPSGAPTDWEMNLQPMATENGERIASFHNMLLAITTLITLLVAGLTLYVGWRFNEKKNPVPSKTTHSTLLEVAWTVVPILILLSIAIPSFRLLRYQLILPKGDVTVKATANSGWYWRYDYPKDNGDFGFESMMLQENEIKQLVADGKARAEDVPRLLAVNNEMVLPVGKTIILQVTAEGPAIHAFAMPSFGIKVDAIPGRLNQAWFKPEREGLYYGQCSRLCGSNHAFMPIAIRVVSEQTYAQWLVEAKKKYAAGDAAPTRVAAAQ